MELIEDKLEEMFAGIEDEKLVNATPEEKNMLRKCNEILEKHSKVNCVNGGNNNNTLLPTKLPPKLTTLLSNTENTKQLNLRFKDQKNLQIPKSMLYLKSIPPGRRHAIGISKELLKHPVRTKHEIVEKNGTNSITKSDRKTTLNLRNTREVKQVRNNVRKSKVKRVNTNKCSKYKKEIGYIKSNNICTKKFEAPLKTKAGRQKVKQSQMQHLSFSDNDTEEKQLQTKDTETKNRPPFILVKNNGNIAVVNTVTPDDYVEKFTRSKKSNNFAYERKTVRGCHSSTLSSRYDADTADSSWKCVFCKIGPHRKGLGDLFGPYIISSECDEYRSIKDTFEKLLKLRRNDSQQLNSSNKSLKFISGTSNSHIRDMTECNYEHLINVYALGMSQVSVDCYEIWVHEECAVWTPNIFVIGSKLTGLEEAVWNSIRYECVYCLKQGALLCCLQRGCKSTSHVPCARESKWLLNESKFWVYCNKHALHTNLNKN